MAGTIRVGANDLLEKESKASTGQAEHEWLVEKSKSVIQENSYKAQEVRENTGWETLSLEEALTSIERMPQLPSIHNLTYILHTCRIKRNLVYTKRLYAYMCNRGLEDHRSLGNYLVPLLVQVGSMCDAQQVFNKLVDRNVYAWTSLITGYIECGEFQHALNLYQRMQEDSVHPSKYTFVALLKACTRLKDAERGQEIHFDVARKGLETDLFIGSTLVDMYAKCGSLAKAQDLFAKLPVRDVVLWTALIAAYAEQGLGEAALDFFKQMQLEGLSPNAVTFVCSLKACGSIGTIDKGEEIHAEIARMGLERDLSIGNTLVDMYTKCSSIAEAQEVFEKLPARTEVSWTALIAGYAEHGLGEEALKLFVKMQVEGLSPTAVTFVCSLKACGNIGDIKKGQDMHSEIVRKGLERDVFVGSTLVDMYAKCGSLAKVREAFDNLPVRNKVSWNALTAGYAQLGESEIVFHMLERMRGEGIQPDGVSFSIVLSVCSHTGLVGKGQKYFEAMSKDYDIAPAVEHHAGMVDVLCRAGQVDLAVAMVEMMPFHANVLVWRTVLDACWKVSNVELGRLAFEHLTQLNEKDAATYVLMSNIYADAHM